MRTDKHTGKCTDRRDEATSAFRAFANAPTNYAIEMKKIKVYVCSGRAVDKKSHKNTLLLILIVRYCFIPSVCASDHVSGVANGQRTVSFVCSFPVGLWSKIEAHDQHSKLSLTW